MKLFIPLYLLLTDDTFARSLKATAQRLSQEINTLGLIIALIGVIIAGIYFALGKQDAGEKTTKAVLGTLIITIAPNIISFIKGLA